MDINEETYQINSVKDVDLSCKNAAWVSQIGMVTVKAEGTDPLSVRWGVMDRMEMTHVT